MKTLSNDIGRAAAPEPRKRQTDGAAQSRGNNYSIVHISDPHISGRYYPEHIKKFTILLRNLIRTGFDHLIISGDIVSTGDAEDFYVARKILGKYDLLDSERLTVVPGNHDIFGGPHRAVDVLSFPRYLRTVDHRRNLALFNEAFTETFDGVRRLNDPSLYPFVKAAGPFAIIGLNSVPGWSLWKNPVGSNGSLDDAQMEALARLAGDGLLYGALPIVAIHHHFNHLVSDAAVNNSIFRQVESRLMRMRKRRKLLRYFNELGVRYIFHGHIHRNELYERNGITLANGAGAVCGDPVQRLKYNLLHFVRGATAVRTVTLPVSGGFPSKSDALQKMRKDILIHRAARAMTV